MVLFSGIPLFEQPRPPELSPIGEQLRENGVAIFDFPEPEFDAIAEGIKQRLDEHFDYNIPRMRVPDAWRFDEGARRLASNSVVLELIASAYGRQPYPFQTIHFRQGSQQPPHSDSIYFSSVPERFMCGVWIALEDVDGENGPLIYYPGSHRWPIYTPDQLGHDMSNLAKEPGQWMWESVWQAQIEQHQIQPKIFSAQKGQAVIWAANLIHGGAPQQDISRTRWSQVTHYFFEGCRHVIPHRSDYARGNIEYVTRPNILSG